MADYVDEDEDEGVLEEDDNEKGFKDFLDDRSAMDKIYLNGKAVDRMEFRDVKPGGLDDSSTNSIFWEFLRNIVCRRILLCALISMTTSSGGSRMLDEG